MNENNNIVSLIKAFPDFKVPGFDIEVYNQQFRDKNSVISATSKKVSYDRHWGCLSLKFARNGNECYHTGHSTYAVNGSNFLILNVDTEYSSYIESEPEVESFTLNFSGKYTNAFFTSLTGKTEDSLEQNLAQSKQCVRFVERLYPKDKAICPLVSKIYNRLPHFYQLNDQVAELFTDLFVAMLQLHADIELETDNIHKIKSSTRQELYRRLNNAKDFIDSCYSDPINLDSISGVACLNREYFMRQFRSYFKTTPMQYLIAKRMEAAKRLLQNPGNSVSEVCRQVGYFDLSSFGKLFRRYHNCSPTEMNNLVDG